MHRIYKVLLDNELDYKLSRNKVHIKYLPNKAVQFLYNGTAEDFVERFRYYAIKYDPLDIDRTQEAKNKLMALLLDFEGAMGLGFTSEIFKFKEIDENRGIEEFYCAILNILDGLAIYNMDMTSKWENILDVLDTKGKVHWFDGANDANDAGGCKDWSETLTRFKELWVNGDRIKYER